MRSCGRRAALFSDQAHALLHPWRPLHDLQAIAISGSLGKQAGALWPFRYLRVHELKLELEARGVHLEQGAKKEDFQCELDDILRGIVRVLALLLADTTQSLTALNLQRYEVVASEPLHDLKGHITNLITELPHILPEGQWISKVWKQVIFSINYPLCTCYPVYSPAEISRKCHRELSGQREKVWR